MKVALVTLLLSTLTPGGHPLRPSAGDGVQGRAFEDILRELLEELRELMITGGPNGTFPILDPYFTPFTSLSLDLPETSQFTLEFSNLTVKGLSTFIVDDIDFSILSQRLDYKFTIPLIETEADNYNLFGNVIDSELVGNGPSEISFKGFEFGGYGKLTIKDGQLYLDEFKIAIDIESVVSNAQGLLDGADQEIFVNKMIEQIIPGVVVTQRQRISDGVEKLIKDLVNPFLEELTLEDLIDWITDDGGDKGQ